MKLLLDTHLLLWASGTPERLSQEAIALITTPENELYFSAASLWEIAIKNALGRPDFQINTRLMRRGLLENGYIEMTITGEHTIAVEALPALHKDPFDRILICQALVEGLILLTSDQLVAQYSGPIQIL